MSKRPPALKSKAKREIRGPKYPRSERTRKDKLHPAPEAPCNVDELIDDDALNLEAHRLAETFKRRDVARLERSRKRLEKIIRKVADGKPGDLVLEIEGKGGKKRELELDYQEPVAFPRPLPELPEGLTDLGGMIIQREGPRDLPVLPDVKVAKRLPLFPWPAALWKFWEKLIPLLRCLAIAPKPTRVEIPVTGSPAMVKVSRDCSRAYVVNNQGQGSVVNVVTETIDATFQVAPHPSPARPYPPGVAASPVVSPFIKGGINHKYRRLYVPASFYVGDSAGGFFVAVVDVNPSSSTYLDTIGWIDCGWLPEQVSFSADGEKGVIANYMEGTATIFRVSDHTPLDEVALFPGAGVDQLDPSLPGTAGTFARSVVTTTLPGKGNVALATLTDTTGFPGFAMVEMDAAGHPVTNFTRSEFGFIDGIAVTPQKDKVLLVDASNRKLHVYDIVGSNFNFDKSIDLPTTGLGRVYMGGIAVRPTGNLAFLGTGRSPSVGIGALTCVNYETGTALDLPENLANGTWDLMIKSFGLPIKPYIFVVSTSGMLTIIPC